MKNILHISFLIVAIWFTLLSIAILPVCAWLTCQFGGPEIVIGFISPFFLMFGAMFSFEVSQWFEA